VAPLFLLPSATSHRAPSRAPDRSASPPLRVAIAPATHSPIEQVAEKRLGRRVVPLVRLRFSDRAAARTASVSSVTTAAVENPGRAQTRPSSVPIQQVQSAPST